MEIQKYEGLLTDSQKRAGYFTSMDEDFVFVWKSNPHVNPIAIFIYDRCTIKEVRDAVEKDRDGEKWD